MSTIPRESAAADRAITVTGDVRRRRVRRVMSLVTGALAMIALFAVYLRLARIRAVNSDGSSQALLAVRFSGGLPQAGYRRKGVSAVQPCP